MSIAVFVFFYIAFCLLTGLHGVRRRMGFIGTFLLSLLVTPVVVLLVLLLTGPSRRRIEVIDRMEADPFHDV